MKKVTIHQPEFLPWLGFFDKISQADLFVILDNVQFEKNYFQNRNKIRISNGWTYISAPIDKKTITKKIYDVRIAKLNTWKIKAKKTIIQNYQKAKYFKDYSTPFFEILNTDYEFIIDFNIDMIKFLFKTVEIKTPMIRASEMSNENLHSTDLIVDICKNTNADIYLSGPSGKDYLEVDKFGDIKVEFHSFTHPTYSQQFNEFLPYMSSIDLLFNHGAENFLKIIKQ